MGPKRNLGKGLEKLERVRTGQKGVSLESREALEEYFRALEGEAPEGDNPELDAYFDELDMQIQQREELLKRRQQ